MAILSKRSFLSAATSAALSVGVSSTLIASPSSANAQAKSSIDMLSGLKTGAMKPMAYTELPGFLSAEQIAPHYKNHYGGALKGHLQLDQELENIARGTETMNVNAYATMQRDRTTKGNSALLHEVYFDGMTAEKSTPGNVLRRLIENRFGSIDRWQADFAAAANTANGWTVLCYHEISGKLYNVVSDAHADGLYWQGVPIIALDMYEHSYYVDYQNNKGAYINKFFEYINWQVAELRISEAT